jgi:hypothetical protein
MLFLPGLVSIRDVPGGFYATCATQRDDAALLLRPAATAVLSPLAMWPSYS